MDEQSPQQTAPPLLSIVVPAYNEMEVIEAFHQRLQDVLAGMSIRSEIVYVNDGSTDDTLTMLRGLTSPTGTVRVLDLSRNFGKEIAMTAGLDHTGGDAVVVIDADLQDPPELIPELVDGWQQGYDVVYATRASRDGETALKKATAKLFYRTIQKLAGKVHIPEDTGDFRLMSRRATEAVTQLREQHRFMKGLFAWVGFPQKSVRYRRDPRYAGTTKWNYWKLWNFSLEGITSFSTAPLRLATYFGFATASLSFAYGLFIIAKTLLLGEPVPGFPSLIALITFLGGVQLLTIGVLGEYLGRMFNEVKHRPLYLLAGDYIAEAVQPRSE
ncbi:MAG: glycosyltransferase family 2 protein [Gammaproteobacteria bacterium]|nr:glycosyltransferase family 2 protein [Gammaproteobacteria bacterium]